jgi:hypothetical protein
VLAGRGRGWTGGGPKARARSRGPGCSCLFLFSFCFCFCCCCCCFCSDGGERGGLTSWPRPGGGIPLYICHGRKAAVRNMTKQTNKQAAASTERQVCCPRNKKQRKKRSTIKILHPPLQITSWNFRGNSAHRVSPPPPAAPPPFLERQLAGTRACGSGTRYRAD